MKTFILLLSLFFALNITHAQDFFCDTPHETINLKSANCCDWNVYEPNIPECQIPSNNLMDYNACQCALTICQTNIIHNALLGNIGNISDCVIGSVSVENPQIAGSSLICSNGETYTIDNLQLGVTVNWSATPSPFFTSDTGCGNSIFIDPISSVSGEGQLNFEFDWTDYGTRSISKNVWVGKALNFEVCDFNSPVINAENILIPGSSCNPMNLIIESGESLLLIGNEAVVNQGFEVKLGGEFEVQVSGGCD